MFLLHAYHDITACGVCCASGGCQRREQSTLSRCTTCAAQPQGIHQPWRDTVGPNFAQVGHVAVSLQCKYECAAQRRPADCNHAAAIGMPRMGNIGRGGIQRSGMHHMRSANTTNTNLPTHPPTHQPTMRYHAGFTLCLSELCSHTQRCCKRLDQHWRHTCVPAPSSNKHRVAVTHQYQCSSWWLVQCSKRHTAAVCGGRLMPVPHSTGTHTACRQFQQVCSIHVQHKDTRSATHPPPHGSDHGSNQGIALSLPATVCTQHCYRVR